jgi:hypothetical protein
VGVARSHVLEPRATLTGPQPETTAAQPAGAPEAAQDRPAPKPDPQGAANVRIEVTISYQVGNSAPIRRSAALIVAEQDSGNLRAGYEVPVPSTVYTPIAAGGKTTSPEALTSFSYRSIGLNLDVRRVSVSDNRVRVSLNVESTGVDDKGADTAVRAPTFPRFSQSFNLVLESGKPLVVAQSSDNVNDVERKQSVELKATILK